VTYKAYCFPSVLLKAQLRIAPFTFGPHVNGTPTLAKLENHMRALPIRLAVVISLLAICASAATTAEGSYPAACFTRRAAHPWEGAILRSPGSGIFVIRGKRLGYAPELSIVIATAGPCPRSFLVNTDAATPAQAGQTVAIRGSGLGR